MADVLIPALNLELNDVVADGTGVSVTAADTGYLTNSLSLVSTLANDVAKGQLDLGRVVLQVTATGATTLTVLAGENPPSNRQVVGDLELTLGNDTYFLVLEAANYTWNDGTVRFETDATVTVRAVYVPHF